MYLISARIKGGGGDPQIFYCFDPTIVVQRLRNTFPDLEVDPDDFSQRDCKHFETHGEAKCAQIAENDSRRRGPIWVFRLHGPGHCVVTGHAERYVVEVVSDAPIPEPLRSNFLSFLEGIKFNDNVSVESVKLVDNKRYPV